MAFLGPVKNSGRVCGRITACLRAFLAYSSPLTSSNVTLMSSFLTGWNYYESSFFSSLLIVYYFAKLKIFLNLQYIKFNKKFSDI